MLDNGSWLKQFVSLPSIISNSFDSKQAKMRKFIMKMEKKIVSRDMLYYFPLARILLCTDPEQVGRVCGEGEKKTVV